MAPADFRDSGPGDPQYSVDPRRMDDSDDLAYSENPGHIDPSDLAKWVARLGVESAALDRSKGAWLRRQAEDEGTFAGVLSDLAETARPLVIHIHNGRRHRGLIRALGADFVVLSSAGQDQVLINLDAIASVRTLPGEPLTLGDRIVRCRTTFAEALSALGQERARVLIFGDDASAAVRGELRAVGSDVLTVRQDGGGAAYLSLSAVVEVSLVESG